jgi:hypothetical protein
LPERKTSNIVTGAGKFIEACFLRRGSQFWEWGRALEIPAAWQYTCSFFHDKDVHAGKLWQVSDQPPTVFTSSCSTWLSLFLKVKTFLQGTRFQDIESINNVMTKFNPVPLGAFDGSFVQYLESCMKCVPVNKDYFQGE